MRGLGFEEKPKVRKASHSSNPVQENGNKFHEKPAKKFTNVADVVENLTRAAEITKHHVSNLTADVVSMKTNSNNIEQRISKIENDIVELKQTNNKILDMLVQINESLKKEEPKVEERKERIESFFGKLK